jgi:hypothetical protein
MITRVRRTVAALTGVLALGIGSAVWATSAASAAPTAATPPLCTARNLSVWVDASQSSGAAGTITYALEFTNISGHACNTFGFPGVSATNASLKQLGDAAARNGRFVPRLVTIPAGGTAHADLSWSDGEVFTSGCRPTAASFIKVFPPDSRGSKLGFFSLQSCTLKHHPYLRVTVVRSGPHLDA